MSLAMVEAIVVNARDIKRCKYCEDLICWLYSSKTGRYYPVSVDLALDGQASTFKTNFHKCDPEKKAVVQARQPQLKVVQVHVLAVSYQPKKDTIAARKEAMQTFLSSANEGKLRQALAVIFNRQTASEQMSDDTFSANGIGFKGGSEATILSDIHKKAERYKSLRGRQIDFVRRKLMHYWRQLVDGAQKGEWNPNA